MNSELLAAVGAVVLAGLIYFAGVQRGKRYRDEDAAKLEFERATAERERDRYASEERVTQVTQAYMANTLRTANLAGALRAGVTSLRSSEEVRAFCDRVSETGESPVIPARYREGLADSDLLEFFRELSRVPDWPTNEQRIFDIQEELRARRRSAV